MGIEVGLCLLEALGGITILAAEQAGVVHADVLTKNATAALTLGRVFFVGNF